MKRLRKFELIINGRTRCYSHLSVERKWQTYWENNDCFKAAKVPGDKKKYILDMFPYPSGAGLHVGHPCGYTATDILSRYWRLKGYDVLHPMGWDAFGLPAEQHAANTGTHPAVTTKVNIDNFRRQLKSLGFSYDWSREISTTDEQYFKWTQWIFLQLFKHGLAFQSFESVNWCEQLGTVLANEEVINGLSERGNFPVTRLPVRQWVLKITEYADKLSSNLHTDLVWPEGTLYAQSSWIGKSSGALIKFPIKFYKNGSSVHSDCSVKYIEVFTTKNETLMGVTFLTIAPENDAVGELVNELNKQGVSDIAQVASKYVEATSRKSDLERISNSTTDKSGSALCTSNLMDLNGWYAHHPITGVAVPLFIGDYVLNTFGTGAVMGVPAHDQRDFLFAKCFHLPVIQVIGDSNEVKTDGHFEFSKDDKLINSGEFDGLTIEVGRTAILNALMSKSLGEAKVLYKLRDWLFSRQRYWGEPIPIYYPVEMHSSTNERVGYCSDFKFHEMYDPRSGHPHSILYDKPTPVDEAELPLCLPSMTDFQPQARAGKDQSIEGCLARALDWKYFKRSDGRWYARETNTMPQWAGSCWYYLRFIDPNNFSELFGKEESKWLPVDIYVGGQEHAVLHLLYARFWHKFLCDIGVVPKSAVVSKQPDGTESTRMISEPFLQLMHQGMILGTDGEKMSKSRGNVINPDSIVEEYGADVLRVYEMFMGPFSSTKPWDNEKMVGISRFLKRVYTMVSSYAELTSVDGVTVSSVDDTMNKTVIKVSSDIENASFNTSISALMIYANEMQALMRQKHVPSRQNMTYFCILLSPFAPHLAEESHEILERSYAKLDGRAFDSEKFQGIRGLKWPDALVVKPLVGDGSAMLAKYAIQVNGKFRANIEYNFKSDHTAVAGVTKYGLKNEELEGEIMKVLQTNPAMQKWINPVEKLKNLKLIVFVPGKPDGYTFGFQGFAIELFGISSAISSTFPLFRAQQSSFRISLKDMPEKNMTQYHELLFPKESKNLDILLKNGLFDLQSFIDPNTYLSLAPMPTSRFSQNLNVSCAECAIYHGVQVGGGEYSRPFVSAASFNDCCAVCSSISTCIAWQFIEGEGCYLKGFVETNVREPIFPNPHAVYGSFYNEPSWLKDLIMANMVASNKVIERPISAKVRVSAPRAVILHGTHCLFRNDTVRRRTIDTIWIGRYMLEKEELTGSFNLDEFSVTSCATMVDEVWVPTEWHKQSFRKTMRNLGFPSVAVAVVPEAVDVELFDKRLIDKSTASSSFIFLSIFKWEYRKGWDILLKSYFESFRAEDPVELHIHSYLPRTERGTPNITYMIELFARQRFDLALHELPKVVWINGNLNNAHTEEAIKSDEVTAKQTDSKELIQHVSAQKIYSRAEMRQLLRDADAFVLPTRGEGWGLPIAEAMAMELPVIVTNCTGVMEYAHANNSFLIPTLPGVDSSGFIIPDGEALSRIMLGLFQYSRTAEYSTEDSFVKKLTTQARATMKFYSPQYVVSAIEGRLRELGSIRGWDF